MSQISVNMCVKCEKKERILSCFACDSAVCQQCKALMHHKVKLDPSGLAWYSFDEKMHYLLKKIYSMLLRICKLLTEFSE